MGCRQRYKKADGVQEGIIRVPRFQTKPFSAKEEKWINGGLRLFLWLSAHWCKSMRGRLATRKRGSRYRITCRWVCFSRLSVLHWFFFFFFLLGCRAKLNQRRGRRSGPLQPLRKDLKPCASTDSWGNARVTLCIPKKCARTKCLGMSSFIFVVVIKIRSTAETLA